MQGQAVPPPGSAPSSHRVLRDVGTSMCRELAAFSFASFRGWEEEGGGKGTAWSVEEKIKKSGRCGALGRDPRRESTETVRKMSACCPSGWKSDVTVGLVRAGKEGRPRQGLDPDGVIHGDCSHQHHEPPTTE